MNAEISIVVPTLNCQQDLEILVNSLEKQTLQPTEVIISDSSNNSHIKDYLDSYKGTLNIIYLKNNRSFPGEKRNEGAKIAKYCLIAFLDVATIPKPNWLNDSFQKIVEGYDVVFGATKYNQSNNIQALIRAATYGRVAHESSPGSLIKRDKFFLSGGFIENVRAGDDLDWRQELRVWEFKCFTPANILLEYSNLPSSIFAMQKKYFIYYLHSAKFRAQKTARDIYLGGLIVLSALIIPRWNYFFEGWSNSPFFIPNITKIYMICFLVSASVYLIVSRLFYRQNEINLLSLVIKVASFIIISCGVLYWNAAIAKWVEDAALYIPHITKIYLIAITSAAILYRGIYLPLKLNISLNYIFPLRWILIGLIGLTFDLIKIPGMFLGVFLAPFQKK
jgi:glycosyltransferase involved in cell wall biosynthesis